MLTIYRWYQRNIAANFSWMRGVGRLNLVLSDLTLRSLLTSNPNGYEYNYHGSAIRFRRKEHFKELILGADFIKGYCGRRPLQKDDVVVDAGAFPGEFTVYAARKAARVLALEPDQENAQTLMENVALNELTNVEVIPKALWSAEGDLDFSRKGPLNSTVEAGGDTKVVGISLDAMIEKYDLERIDFVKMDIEGAEIQAMQGAGHVMDHYRPFFAIASYHDLNGSMTCTLVEKLFRERGYNAVTGYPEHLTTYGWREI